MGQEFLPFLQKELQVTSSISGTVMPERAFPQTGTEQRLERIKLTASMHYNVNSLPSIS